MLLAHFDDLFLWHPLRGHRLEAALIWPGGGRVLMLRAKAEIPPGASKNMAIVISPDGGTGIVC